jgi:hypothetical protein
MTDPTTETIGCDLGDKVTEICILGTDGKPQRASVRTTRVAMTSFFTRAPAHVAIEVGGHSRWVSALLTELGHRVTVANARRVKVISQSDNKTDRNDAELLARLARADMGLLSPVVHRKAQAQADLAVAMARDVLSRQGRSSSITYAAPSRASESGCPSAERRRSRGGLATWFRPRSRRRSTQCTQCSTRSRSRFGNRTA